MITSDRIRTFKEFWPFYLGEHRNPYNRMLHYAGTSLAIASILLAVLTGKLLFVLLAPLVAYSCAWTGHFVFEKNRPATFQYPLWSFIADFKMLALFLIGKL